MSHPQQVNLEAIRSIIQSESIDTLSMVEICELFRQETSLFNYKPDSIFQIDPRSGELIVYNSSRAHRPRTDSELLFSKKEILPADNCPICSGKTTGIMDIAELSEGFTFINKNMFPIFFPFVKEVDSNLGSLSFGLHFLQWTSSIHDTDWHNMPLKDCKVVLSRLGALEEKLLLGSDKILPTSETSTKEKTTYGYVSIIKNYGKAAGSSIAHGHQQIVYSNIMPKQFFNNWNFYTKIKANFTEYLLNENPDELLVKDYQTVSLMVPYFMRRPFDMFLILKDPNKKFIHELNDAEIEDVARAWQEATRVILQILQTMGKEEAYNITVNNGPGAGLYLEFLPFTQLIGGYEKIGLWVCQESPNKAAETLRDFFSQLKPL
jgi:galactose-1-phosphate uridylyltransferase